jgi:heavy metal sensor kinase
MKSSSLRFRVTTWYIGFLAAALLLFSALVYFGLAGYLESTLDHSLSEEATAIGTNFIELVNKRGDAFVRGEINESYAPEISGRFIRITRADGSVLYQSGPLKKPFVETSNIPRLSKMPATDFFRRQSVSPGETFEIYALPYRNSAGQVFLIETSTLRKPLDHILRTLLLTLLLPTPFILAVAAVGGYLLMNQPLKPVVALTRETERIGGQTFSQRLPVIRTGDELERLSIALNGMLARLEDALAHIHRFSGDVSHELRTPLTILRGELEHMVQLPSLDPQTADSVGSALEEIDRLTKIVDSLMVISRLDSGDAGIEFVRVDLQSLACFTAEQMHVLAEDKGVAVVCKRSSAVEVLGDPTRLKQIVVNLLDNAIKYTEAGGVVEMTTSATQTEAILRVADNGIGVPAAALPHVFERFYRADKARSRDSGGAGLGLSIVKAICTAHGGCASITGGEGGGTVVIVKLPLYSVAAEQRGLEVQQSRPHSTVLRQAPASGEDSTDSRASLRLPSA